MKYFALLLMILLPVENLYFQLLGTKMRVSEILGLLLLIYILLLGESRYRLSLPQKSIYFILFIFVSSISLIFADAQAYRYGLIYQSHQIILFLCVVVGYSIFLNHNNFRHLRNIEKKIFIFFDLILLYGLAQVFFFNILGIELTFGMDSFNWRNNIFSYRQDIINPFGSYFENAPWMRPPSIFGEPVYLGLFCVWLSTISILRYIEGERNYYWIFRILVSIILLVFVASRAAIFALAITLFLYLLFFSKNKIRFIVISSIVITSVGLIGFLFRLNILEGYLEGRFDEANTRIDPRLELFAAQISGFLESPILGNGRGMTLVLTDKVMPTLFQDNVSTGGWSYWLTLLYDSGILGVISLLVYILSLYRIKNHYFSKNVSSESKTKIYFFGILGIMFTGILFGPLTGGIFWMAILLFYLSTLEFQSNFVKKSILFNNNMEILRKN